MGLKPLKKGGSRGRLQAVHSLDTALLWAEPGIWGMPQFGAMRAKYSGVTDEVNPARMSRGRHGSFGMLLSCAQGPLGWRLAQAAGGLRVLREAGVDLEIAKNLAWHGAGGQCARLAAEGSVALLPNGCSFSPCLAGRGDCSLPQELWGHLGLAGVEGWDAHCSYQRHQGLLLWKARAPTQFGVSANSQLGNGREAAWQVLGGVMLHPGSFWLRDTLTGRNVQTSKGRSCARRPWWLQPLGVQQKEAGPLVPLQADRDDQG